MSSRGIVGSLPAISKEKRNTCSHRISTGSSLYPENSYQDPINAASTSNLLTTLTSASFFSSLETLRSRSSAILASKCVLLFFLLLRSLLSFEVSPVSSSSLSPDSDTMSSNSTDSSVVGLEYRSSLECRSASSPSTPALPCRDLPGPEVVWKCPSSLPVSKFCVGGV